MRPAACERLIDVVFEELQPKTVTTNVAALRADLRALDRKIANLTAAIEDGAAMAPLVSKLQARQTERDALLTAIGAADAMRANDRGPHEVERKVLRAGRCWRERLAGDISASSDKCLREALEGPLRFAPRASSFGSSWTR